MTVLKDALSMLQATKMRMMNAFEGYGRLVAARPWELIIGTMTLAVSVLSMGVVTVKDWSSAGAQRTQHQVSSTINLFTKIKNKTGEGGLKPKVCQKKKRKKIKAYFSMDLYTSRVINEMKNIRNLLFLL